MKKKVKSTKPMAGGTMLTFDDGTEEFMEGVQVSLTKPEGMDESMPEDESQDEEMMESIKKRQRL